ncbi:MAG: hypothetical protein MRY57_03650 [Candidatus Pacebacteria bacterium]|nr:hypothetical protein [Candidatus Paceibacterota bacterium]
MLEPEILVEGNFTKEDISVRLNTKKFTLTDDIEKEIDDIWKEKIKEAKENNLNLYNGTSYRLLDIKKENNKLHIVFQEMEFRQRFGLREIHRRHGIHTDLYRMGCFVSATVKTADGKYLMVRLSGKSMNMNTIEVLGGIMETNINLDSDYIFKVVSSELKEEIGVLEKEIIKNNLIAVFRGGYTNICFYFEVELSINSDEVKQRFDKNRDIDVSGVLVLTLDEYKDTLQNHNLNKQFIYKLFTKDHK